MTRLRIALVASSYDPYAGGVEEHVRQVARSLSALGHEVVVWTVDRGEHLGVRRVDDIEVRYLPTPLPARSTGALIRFVARLPTALVKWWRSQRALRPDILHVHCFGPNGVYATVLGRVSRTPVVLSGHGETFMDDDDVFGRSALLRRSLRQSLASAAAVTACSHAALEDLQDRFGLRGGEVVFNGVDLTVSSPGCERDEPRVVLAVGRVERTKGFDLLVRAFDEGGLPHNVRLVIGGDGSVRQALETDVRERGLASRVTFTGRLTPQEVAHWMARASVVVVPSRREAFGIVALEAWRSGTPLVVTRHGGPSEFVRDNVDGLVVRPEHVDELSGAIRRLLDDEGLAARLAAAGSRSVQAFTWDHVARRYVQAYERVVEARR